MHELHEIAHITTGRLVCGCWATRDFNVWKLCDSCGMSYQVIALYAGPVFTFIMLWLGRYWLKYGRSPDVRSLGFVFILGNMPFGRLYMAATGSGDEAYGFRLLFAHDGHSNVQLIRLATFVIVAAFCMPPLISAYRAMANRKKLLIFLALMIVPLMLDTIVLLIALNGLLQRGLLNQVFIMGTPLLITLWFISCLTIIGINYRSLIHFTTNSC